MAGRLKRYWLLELTAIINVTLSMENVKASCLNQFKKISSKYALFKDVVNANQHAWHIIAHSAQNKDIKKKFWLNVQFCFWFCRHPLFEFRFDYSSTLLHSSSKCVQLFIVETKETVVNFLTFRVERKRYYIFIIFIIKIKNLRMRNYLFMSTYFLQTDLDSVPKVQDKFFLKISRLSMLEIPSALDWDNYC